MRELLHADDMRALRSIPLVHPTIEALPKRCRALAYQRIQDLITAHGGDIEDYATEEAEECHVAMCQDADDDYRCEYDD